MLAFRHTHTEESLALVYWEKGSYLPEALTRINRLCRDFRTGEIHAMDPALFDLLNTLQRLTAPESQGESPGFFEIISAYRSLATNEALAWKSGGVSRRSLHMECRALDVRLPGTPTVALQRARLQLAQGGVGYYPDSNFVHLDTGPVRHW